MHGHWEEKKTLALGYASKVVGSFSSSQGRHSERSDVQAGSRKTMYFTHWSRPTRVEILDDRGDKMKSTGSVYWGAHYQSSYLCLDFVD